MLTLLVNLIGLVLSSCIYGFGLMQTWNFVIADLFSLPEISFFQSVVLFTFVDLVRFAFVPLKEEGGN